MKAKCDRPISNLTEVITTGPLGSLDAAKVATLSGGLVQQERVRSRFGRRVEAVTAYYMSMACFRFRMSQKLFTIANLAS